jgi:hypothetical protein
MFRKNGCPTAKRTRTILSSKANGIEKTRGHYPIALDNGLSFFQ